MKNHIYTRLADITTEDLLMLRAVWNRLIADRTRAPRHDYVGKCAIRATLILEGRGALDQPPPHPNKPIRRTTQRRT